MRSPLWNRRRGAVAGHPRASRDRCASSSQLCPEMTGEAACMAWALLPCVSGGDRWPRRSATAKTLAQVFFSDGVGPGAWWQKMRDRNGKQLAVVKPRYQYHVRQGSGGPVCGSQEEDAARARETPFEFLFSPLRLEDRAVSQLQSPRQLLAATPLPSSHAWRTMAVAWESETETSQCKVSSSRNLACCYRKKKEACWTCIHRPSG